MAEITCLQEIYHSISYVPTSQDIKICLGKKKKHT